MESTILNNLAEKITKLDSNKLDPRINIKARSKEGATKIFTLIQTLNELIKEEKDNPQLGDSIKKGEELISTLIRMQNAYQGSQRALSWLTTQDQLTIITEINRILDNIINKLESWYKDVEKKVNEIKKNNHLKNLPRHPNTNRFYVKVKELNPDRTIGLHPLTEQQAAIQSRRTNEQLLQYDAVDAIAGYRQFSKEDNKLYPGSIIAITNGHHRLSELYKRYLQGRIDGNKLVEFQIDFSRLK